MDNVYNEKLRARLRRLRDWRGLTQEQAAKRSKGTFSSNVLSNWERGETVIPAAAIPAICRIYEITPNQFLGWKEKGNKADQAIEDIKRINNFTQGIASKYEEPQYDNLLIAASGAENFDEEELKLLEKDIEMVKNLGKNNN